MLASGDGEPGKLPPVGLGGANDVHLVAGALKRGENPVDHGPRGTGLWTEQVDVLGRAIEMPWAARALPPARANPWSAATFNAMRATSA